MSKYRKIARMGKDIVYETYYQYCCKKMPIKDKRIIFESRTGKEFAANLWYLLQEIRKEQETYEIGILVTKECREQIEKKFLKASISNVTFITVYSAAYYRWISTAKYLFVDTSMERVYVKREGQVLINTWHGTPLKKMGRDENTSAYAMWNIQRNFLMSDYLLYPSEAMCNLMMHAYQIAPLYQGTVLLEGYPRNSIFFEEERGDIKERLGLVGKQVIMYMPTWRGIVGKEKQDEQLTRLKGMLDQLDKKLDDSQVLFVKLHPFVTKGLSMEIYKHIRNYEETEDVYEFLTCCDTLITDYSSIFFDFANTRKKIILFPYDLEEYQKDRGLYIDLEQLPFPIVYNVEELSKELQMGITYDDRAFLEKFCTYDNKDAAIHIVEQVLHGKKCCKEWKNTEKKKKNILLYGSEFGKSGITTALLNLFENLDLQECNYFVAIDEEALSKDCKRLSLLPKEAYFIPAGNTMHFSIGEALAYYLYFHWNKNGKWVKNKMNRLFQRECRRRFQGATFNQVIQYTGYEVRHIKLYQQFSCPSAIWVHNDMLEEIKLRKNQHLLTLQEAYRSYDVVAIVTVDLYEATRKIGGETAKIVTVNNCHNYKEVQRKGKLSIKFDLDTQSNVTEEQLLQIVASDATKVITVGRFSPEKGHFMLIEAFGKYLQTYPDSYLIIIGGHGPLYEETIEVAGKVSDRIIVIKSLTNPMAVMAQCDLFVLSSYYEGLGLTLLEADALGLPTISTDVQGPRGFVKEHGGTLVAPTVEGLQQGMEAFMKQKIKPMSVDYEAYNQKAVAQFKELFEYE